MHYQLYGRPPTYQLYGLWLVHPLEPLWHSRLKSWVPFEETALGPPATVEPVVDRSGKD